MDIKENNLDQIITSINKIEVSINSLTKLLHKVSQLSSIQNNDKNLISIETIKENIINHFKSLSLSNDINLMIDIKDDYLYRSIQLPEQVLNVIIKNIIENCITFQNPDKKVKLIHIVIKIDKGFLVLKFMDNGVGINKEDLSKIYDLFFIGNTLSKGYGIGLFLVKEAVKSLNGFIKTTSVPGEETQIIIGLPAILDKLSPIDKLDSFHHLSNEEPFLNDKF
jgi:signal transduction histidine kinase